MVLRGAKDSTSVLFKLFHAYSLVFLRMLLVALLQYHYDVIPVFLLLINVYEID